VATIVLSDYWRVVVTRKIDIFLNNQPDALIIQTLFCYKTLHVSAIFSAHHQEFSTVHSALVSFMQVSDDRFQAESVENS
jgi:predicted ATP-binding protein involved in virulence